MNISARLISLAALAGASALSSVGVHADEADGSQFASKFESGRTRSEVAAEAAAVPKTRSQEPAGSRVLVYKSTAAREAVRAQAADAVRTKRVASGEVTAQQ